MSNTISTYTDWTSIEDYQFKILILASVLAENNLAFRGTLTTMCNWLGIQNNSTNTKKIKKAIADLQEKDYIFYNVEGRTHHISIRNKGLKNSRVVKIKKQWIEEIKRYNAKENNKINQSWQTMLKALITVCNYIEQEHNSTSDTVITMKILGYEIGKSEEIAGDIIDKLVDCKFDDGLTITKKVLPVQVYFDNKSKIKKYRGTGTQVKVAYNWNK